MHQDSRGGSRFRTLLVPIEPIWVYYSAGKVFVCQRGSLPVVSTAIHVGCSAGENVKVRV
jgi:hypothetical protein